MMHSDRWPQSCGAVITAWRSHRCRMTRRCLEPKFSISLSPPSCLHHLLQSCRLASSHSFSPSPPHPYCLIAHPAPLPPTSALLCLLRPSLHPFHSCIVTSFQSQARLCVIDGQQTCSACRRSACRCACGCKKRGCPVICLRELSLRVQIKNASQIVSASSGEICPLLRALRCSIGCGCRFVSERCGTTESPSRRKNSTVANDAAGPSPDTSRILSGGGGGRIPRWSGGTQIESQETTRSAVRRRGVGCGGWERTDARSCSSRSGR